ncbi:glycosyltransferase [Mangrovibacterium marinum]|uniref:Glycosyltransferase involved in cell wall biosynthesis n=1 Tax=Mangrovibacterium marinum TaxID=1639118 RepID=A0A2T5C0N3_9BACT|nr:glycosyltransferase [Mangrovibacterium marinum]PTN08129.1 glycosyltransferase involved in cell wall biosynthesis [Mangrovibacterium marinum]
MPKKVDIVVTNDLVTDNRVHKVAESLLALGYSPRLIGRLRRNSLPLEERSYPTRRLRLFFDRGPLFYSEFNIRIFFKLLFSPASIILSNDLDTLGACYLAAAIAGKKLVYDSHEYFTQVPELIERPFKQKLWLRLERFILPRLKNAFTVSQSIADAYRQMYGTDFKVVRNLPLRSRQTDSPIDHSILPHDEKIILYQGALNMGRGLEYAIQAMRYVNGAQLWLVGSGDLDEQLQLLTRQLGLQFKVRFWGQVPFQELAAITAQADLGLSIEEDLGLNYRFALPNKLFDYIQHQIPVLVSPLPEMSKIVRKYEIGQILNSTAPQEMAEQIQQMLADEPQRKTYRKKLKIASSELCWENEIHVLEHLFKQIK